MVGAPAKKKIVLSLKRHLGIFPHGGRMQIQAHSFLNLFFDAAPYREYFSNLSSSALKRHLLKRHLTLSEVEYAKSTANFGPPPPNPKISKFGLLVSCPSKIQEKSPETLKFSKSALPLKAKQLPNTTVSRKSSAVSRKLPIVSKKAASFFVSHGSEIRE